MIADKLKQIYDIKADLKSSIEYIRGDKITDDFSTYPALIVPASGSGDETESEFKQYYSLVSTEKVDDKVIGTYKCKFDVNSEHLIVTEIPKSIKVDLNNQWQTATTSGATTAGYDCYESFSNYKKTGVADMYIYISGFATFKFGISVWGSSYNNLIYYLDGTQKGTKTYSGYGSFMAYQEISLTGLGYKEHTIKISYNETQGSLYYNNDRGFCRINMNQ